MPKLTDTQSIILTRAARRPDNLALPLPEGLAGAAAKMVVAKMTERGWIEEVDANLRRGEPLWRETGDGHGTTLVVTKAGLEAIGIETVVATTVSNLRGLKLAPDQAVTVVRLPEGEDHKSVAIRNGTKQAQIIDLLQRPDGASISEIVAVTGWAQHTARGMISGALKKKLGLPITTEKADGKGLRYRLVQNGCDKKKRG